MRTAWGALLLIVIIDAHAPSSHTCAQAQNLNLSTTQLMLSLLPRWYASSTSLRAALSASAMSFTMATASWQQQQKQQIEQEQTACLCANKA
jgi:hypothetical protein